MTLRVKYRNPRDLIPNSNNPKEHRPAQIKKLAASFAEFGFNAPVLVDEQSEIIAGHGRVQAAIEAELEKVPTITLTHLSDQQKRAYLLADNRLSEVGTGWDYELLFQEYQALEADGFDVELTGFDEDFFGSQVPGADLARDNPGDTYEENHAVIVVCDSQEQQQVVYDKLLREGYNLKVVSN